jgi:hypothetical protein
MAALVFLLLPWLLIAPAALPSVREADPGLSPALLLLVAAAAAAVATAAAAAALLRCTSCCSRRFIDRTSSTSCAALTSRIRRQNLCAGVKNLCNAVASLECFNELRVVLSHVTFAYVEGGCV